MSSSNPTLKAYITLMRPYQWSKNLFVLAPAFFGFMQYTFSLVWLDLLVAFVSFCLLASAVYCFNDIIDCAADRAHPSKKFRPIASGLISKQNAFIFAFVLLLMGGGGATFLILRSHFEIIFPFALYLVLNLAYSLKLKHIAILDIFIISSGFVIRLFVGSIATNVELSHFIIITSFLLALFLALAKRRDDVILLEKGIKARRNIDGYNRTFLDIAMGICAALVMVAYIFYSIDESVQARLGTSKLYLTSIFVLLGIFRYMQLAFVSERSGNPSKIFLTDSFLQLCILGWILSFVGLVWWGNLNL